MISCKKINEVLLDCLLKPDEMENGKPKDGTDWKEVNSVMLRVGFSKIRLDKHRDVITEMLNSMPDAFKASAGGGMSFLNMCMDNKGNHWGEHNNMDELIALGIGIDLVMFPMPKDMWSILPGGMPYVRIDL